MLVQALLGELQHEATNTRKLFEAIPDEVLSYRPNEFNWSIAEQAAHIAELYNWWTPTLNEDEFKVDQYSYDKGDISSMVHIKERLEQNLANAISTLERYPESRLMETWRMTRGGQDILPPMPRVQVIRGFLMSHLYHHRGELVAYLRVNHKPVPGLYGPSYEEMAAMQ